MTPIADIGRIQVQGLDVAYGNAPVLHQVSASFPERQVTAILGPSGCGKSTLLRVINRTLELTPGARVTGGQVHVKGRNILHASEDIRSLRKQVGIVQQRPLAFPMSIQENVDFGRRHHHGRLQRKERDRITASLLERVGLWDEVKHRLDSSATRLSIGQLQRLCIARTLANDPDVILMDEPCSALDPESTATIEALIQELKATVTILIVTHNIAQARRISDQILFLLDGKVAEAGTNTEVMGAARNPRVRRFLSGEEG